MSKNFGLNLWDAVAALVITAVFAVAIVAVFNIGVLPQYKIQQVVGNQAAIETRGVDVDKQFIDWGAITVGGSKTETVTVTNSGNLPYKLNITAINWNPTNASQYFFLLSNYTDFSLAPKATAPVELTLRIDETAVNSGIMNFTFNILFDTYVG